MKRGYEMRVIGVPKTIDNDLPHTDHCPGYGSVIKYNATTVMEIAADVTGMATDDGACCSSKSWAAPQAGLPPAPCWPTRQPGDAPHIILCRKSP